MNFPVQRSDVGEFRRRFRWMVVAILVGFTAVFVRLVQLQIFQGDQHRATARENIVFQNTLATTRGVIRDTTGKVLAANRPSYNVYGVPAKIDLEKVWPRAVQYMRLGEKEAAALRDRIVSIRSKSSRLATQQILLVADVDRDVLGVLATNADELVGIEAVPSPVRYYPYGSLGAHTIGHMREIDGEMLTRLLSRGYKAGDRLGATGVERRWESYLKGQRGWKKALKGVAKEKNLDELEARYLEEPRSLEPVPGRDISLTVDIELVKAMEQAMRGQLAGAVVVVDVRTGRILGALSKPGFDPNVLSGGVGKDQLRDAFRRLYSDPLNPMLDKTISATYPPGSTYKPFSALAALQDGTIRPADQADCHGGLEYGRRYFRCTGVHRRVNLHQAIVQSCNTYFYQLGAGINIDRLAQIGMDFGFGVRTGIGVNPEARGRMPTRSWYTHHYKGQFLGGWTLLAAIGQGATTVTVLQLALSYAALANGGTLYQPQLVRSIETSDGTVVQEFPPRVRRVVELDQSDLKIVKDGMSGVIMENEGTGYKYRIDGIDMAGKTGTAQVDRVTGRGVDPKKVWYFNRDHAWFAGYAPAQSPEIAIVVLVEHGGGGGKNAVPVAMRVVQTWNELKQKRLAQKGAPGDAKRGQVQ
ncbi:MAG: penicillin-binding protein 2 [Polyangiaceae bacterium]|nr:penicillin-binding protein 2 [Polyangiaceae bacterium]